MYSKKIISENSNHVYSIAFTKTEQDFKQIQLGSNSIRRVAYDTIRGELRTYMMSHFEDFYNKYVNVSYFSKQRSIITKTIRLHNVSQISNILSDILNDRSLASGMEIITKNMNQNHIICGFINVLDSDRIPKVQRMKIVQPRLRIANLNNKNKKRRTNRQILDDIFA